MPAPVPPFKRLYENMRETDSGCWEWLGQVGSSGYGQIKAFGKMMSCHRLSYELHYGPVPTGCEVMHSCDNRRCINPDHLSAGTHAENMAELKARGRPRIGKPNPKRGEKNEQSKQVMVLGQPYGSLNEAERELNLGGGTVAYWIKHNPKKAVLLTPEQYKELKYGKRQ